MKKVFFPLLALAALAVSCTETDVVAGDHAGANTPILAKIQTGTEKTRVPYEGDDVSANNVIANVVIYRNAGTNADQPNFSDIMHNGVITFTNGTDPFSFKTPQFYPSKQVAPSLFLVGAYPNAIAAGANANTDDDPNIWRTDGANSNATTSNGTMSADFGGKIDLMLSTPKKTVKEDARGTYQTLVFKHVLTKLVFLIKGIDATWGKIKSVSVYGTGVDYDHVAPLANTVSVDLNTVYDAANPSQSTINANNATFTQNTANPGVKLYEATGTGAGTTADPYVFQYTDDEATSEITLNEDDFVTFAYTMLQPINTADGTKYFLRVVTEKDPSKDPQGLQTGGNQQDIVVPLLKTFDGDEFLGYTMGKQFVIRIDCSGSEIKAKAQMEAWVPEGNTDIDIEDAHDTTN